MSAMPLTIIKSDQELHSHDLVALRNLLDLAYEGDFSVNDWLHTIGGVRFVGKLSGEIVAHGAVVPRDFSINGQSTRVGYLEGIAISPRLHGQGFGSQLLTEISEYCRSNFELSMLSTDEFNFYGKFGWRQFQGKSGVIRDGHVTMTPEEDEGLMYLFGKSSPVINIQTAYCDWRPGDVW